MTFRTVAVGFFDGVHLGHRRILAGADAALTFRNHPATVLSPDKVPGLLMSAEERLAAIASALRTPKDSVPQNNQTNVVALEFTERMKGLTPCDFIAFLKRTFPGIEAIRCGPNWRFGAKGAGNAEFARSMGLKVEEVPFAMHEGAAISSTRIRGALADGDVAAAAAMLGRKWSIAGAVFAGKGEGRKIGFPTINLRPFEGSVPLRSGVYEVATEMGVGVANWGRAPTMGASAWKDRVLEVHLMDGGEGVSPPPEMSVGFLRFIRDERKFASLDELSAQIAADCANVRQTPESTF